MPVRELDFFSALVGRTWISSGVGPMGAYSCERRLRYVLDDMFVQMDVSWTIGSIQYREMALIGPDVQSGRLCIWSFTSDGKRSLAEQVPAENDARNSLVFEADMPDGRARMVLWPDEGGYRYSVEAKSPTGWNRFLEQQWQATE